MHKARAHEFYSSAVKQAADQMQQAPCKALTGAHKVVGQREDELDPILLCLGHEIVQALTACSQASAPHADHEWLGWLWTLL